MQQIDAAGACGRCIRPLLAPTTLGGATVSRRLINRILEMSTPPARPPCQSTIKPDTWQASKLNANNNGAGLFGTRKGHRTVRVLGDQRPTGRRPVRGPDAWE